MSMTLRGRLLLALLIAGGMFACFTKRDMLPPWPQFTAANRHDAAALTRALNQRNYVWNNIQARVSFRIEGMDAKPGELKGDLLLHPPQNVRLRTYTPFGTIAFDLLYKDRSLELYLPHRREVVIVSLDQLKTLAFGGIPLTLPKAQDWLRIIQPWQETKGNVHYTLEPDENPEKAILRADSERYRFAWDSGHIEQLILENQFVLTYANWDFFDGKELASQIQMTPANKSTGQSNFRLHLQLLEVHDAPEFPPQVFDSVDMTHLKVTRLQK